MRCNQCNKFVSNDTEQEPQEQDEPKIEGITFTASYDRVIACAECSQELRSALIEFCEKLEIPEKCEPTDEPSEDGQHEWEFDLEVTPSERTEGKGRGIRTFYGVEVSGMATCSKCGTEVTLSLSEDVQASSMDEV